MIQANPENRYPATGEIRWQRLLAEAISCPQALLNYLDIPAQHPQLPAGGDNDFPLRVPRGFADRMRRGDPTDPLFRQVWSAQAESVDTAGWLPDAVGDLQQLRPGGIIHKYQGRALVIATGACAVHCRYCFRRHFPYADSSGAPGGWADTLREIAADSSLREIILSGGDPLSLNDRRLKAFAEGLGFIPHVQRLRIHTRLPVVLPERVDEPLLDWLGACRQKKIVVLHVNHANELDAAVAAACARLRTADVTLLNQSVLLRGVNDNADALTALSEKLFECGVLPYYVNLLDRVRGAAHFEVPESEARKLMHEVSCRLPGYLVPKLVRDQAGAPYKLPIYG